MAFFDNIRQRLFRRYQLLRSYVCGWGDITVYKFGETIFRNIVELLTDLTNDVEWHNVDARGNLRFAEFKAFFERDGQLALWRVYRHGYCVIGIKDGKYPSFRLLDNAEYEKTQSGGKTYIRPKIKDYETYVMRSETFREENKSDYQLCVPFVQFLDNLFNASNTSTEKMGTFVVASPETPTGFPTPVVLEDDQKKELEKEIAREYGSLSKQRHIMLLPRGMRFQTISMEGIDRKLVEKVRLCVLAICDRIKVPANQVAIIDANAAKTLANGTELREGDYNKYQSFERLLNHTFVRFAAEIGMNVTYTIYNKPLRNEI